MLHDLKTASSRAVGMKQTIRAINTGNVSVVYLARDTDDHISKRVTKECRKAGVEIIIADSMEALGMACGIQVGAATAALLK
ncbi:MAG TPA: ribosomal L7Ae/L30e/S12e/Gadd45 family protein [Bacillota bacterium]|nr:ribosomal L7Ae/L30e/S12e/Gadd45 family protein [Bacillota bacterium]